MPRFQSRWTSALIPMLLALAFAAGAQAQEIKIASIAPEISGWMRAMRAGADEIRERTEDRVRIRFYPGGVMGDDAQVLRRIRIGQLQGGAFTVGGLSDRYPALQLYGIPLLFRSLDEVDHVRGQLDPVLKAGLEDAGFVSFGFIEGGFAQLMSNEPVVSVDDMRRRKVWIPEGDQISFLSLQALGVSPVVLPITDVLTGLQTGLLDVIASSPSAAVFLQWHTRVRYITDLPVVYTMGVFAIDAATFRRITAPDQAIVTQVMTRVVTDLDRAARTDNKGALEAMYETGIEPVAVDRANVGPWRETVETIYPTLRARDDIDVEFLERVLSTLEDFRSGNPVAVSVGNP